MTYHVATITLNPAYDLLGYCQKIELGNVNLVDTTGLLAAGKGINVAKVLSGLGVHVTVGGLLGTENKNGYHDVFKSLQITDKFIMIPGRTRINVKLTEKNSDVTDINFSGFNVDDNDWQKFIVDSLDWLKSMDMVAICGSLPKGISLDQFTNWMKRVKALCPKIIFDSSLDALVAGLNAKPWLIKPNHRELEMFFQKKLTTLDDIKSAAQELVFQGIEHVVVSLGSKGALWVTSAESWYANSPKCNVVSTVGAGDSMVAGIMYGLFTDQSIKNTLGFASAVAALSVQQVGVGVFDMQAVNTMLDKIEVTAK